MTTYFIKQGFYLTTVPLALFFSAACGGDDSSGSGGGGGQSGAGASGGVGATGAAAGAGGGAGTSGSGGTAGGAGAGGAGNAAGSAGAAGTAGSAGSAGTSGSGGAGGDTTAPTITGTGPVNGEKGVEKNAFIFVVFSEPMNQASAELAFQSADITGAKTFQWDPAGKIMRVDPSIPFVYATGTTPANTTAKKYSFTITTAAQDLAGNSLAANYTSSFTTLRSITQTLSAEPKLTGHVFSNGSASTLLCSVGDGPANITLRGFASFLKSPLAPGAKNVDLGELNLTATMQSGNPWGGANLGNPRAHGVSYTALNSTAYSAPLVPTGSASIAGISTYPATRVLNVGALVKTAVEGTGTRVQFRIQFEKLHNGNGTSDFVRFTTTPTLKVRYEAP